MRDIKRHRSVYVLLAIPLVYYIIFKYVPIFNGQIAFKDYMALDGVLGSRWIGLEHFKTFVNSYYFVELLRNTLMYSFGKLIFSLPLAIILAIAIYESNHTPGWARLCRPWPIFHTSFPGSSCMVFFWPFWLPVMES